MHDTLVLAEAGNLTKAMISHEKALQWQELFCLAAQVEMADEDVIDMGYRVAGVCSNSLLDVNLIDIYIIFRGPSGKEATFGSRPSLVGLFHGCP